LSEQCYLFMKEKAEIEEFNADLTFLVGWLKNIEILPIILWWVDFCVIS
jgi:hypothetical protein